MSLAGLVPLKGSTKTCLSLPDIRSYPQDFSVLLGQISHSDYRRNRRDESSEGCLRHHHANVLGLQGEEDGACWGQCTSSCPGQVPGAGPLISVQTLPSCMVREYKILVLDEIIASYNELILFCFLNFFEVLH